MFILPSIHTKKQKGLHMERISGEWCGTDLVDLLGNAFAIGDKVAKSHQCGRASSIEIAEVSRIDGGRLYLSGSKVAIRYPSRLLNLSLYCRT